MKKDSLYLDIFFLILLSIFSILINFNFGNIGVFPTDTFAFFDTAYNILINNHPFKDIWVTTGPLVDYVQSIFFRIFGVSWFSYILHGAIFNFLISITIYITLIKFDLKSHFAFIYSASVATLCYPVSGTPFAYQHSIVLSIISLMIFFLAIRSESKIYWFVLPITTGFSFLSMHVPSSYIIAVLSVGIISYFFFHFDKEKIISFILGCISFFLFILIFFLHFEIPFLNFIQQYILFPMSLGEYRITGNEYSHISLLDRFTFRGIFGHFKFIHLFSLIILVMLLFSLKRKNDFKYKQDLIIFISLLSTTYLLIFHQLITSNQTFIFFIIPILAGFSHVLLEKYIFKKNAYKILILILVAFISIKYNNEYNVNRKFMDLQNTDLKKSVDASLLDKKLKNLKWITPFFNGKPIDEINLLKDSIKIIGDEKRNKMLITDYQFISAVLEQNLNIPNRWYTAEGSSYPLKDHKYFKFYKSFFSKKIEKNKIEVIYIINNPQGDIKIENFLIYLKNYCSNDIQNNNILSTHLIKKCTN